MYNHNQLEWKNAQRNLMISIIGRPNVGKSSLFNCLLKRNHKKLGAIAFDQPGVTRDFHFANLVLDEVTNAQETSITLVDTGGFFPDTQPQSAKESIDLLHSIEQHAQLAINESDLILLVVDVRAGLLPIDRQLATMAKQQKKPFWVLANKVDVEKLEDLSHDFYSLGIDSKQLFLTSSAHGRGIETLLLALHHFALEQDTNGPLEVTAEETISLSLIGTPNAGKSTLMNALLGYNRSLVTPIAGTTMDPVVDDFFITIPKHAHPLNPEQTQLKVNIQDTAGIRRIKSIDSKLEAMSVFRSLKSMDTAQVVLLLIDCVKGVTHQDRRLVEVALEKGCSVIVLLNKIDLLENTSKEFRKEKLIQVDPGIANYIQIIPIAAQKGINLDLVKKAISKTYLARLKEFKPQYFLEYLQTLTTAKPFYPTRGTRNPLKIKYANLVRQHPPTFLLFANHTEKITKPYRRYLTNGLRSQLKIPNSPIHLIFKRNEESKTSYR